MVLYYFDTSIWLDYYEKRGQHGEFAFRLLLKIIEENSAVVCSDIHIKELKQLGYNMDQIHSIFRIVRPLNVRRASIFRAQLDEACRLAQARGIPSRDALHAILARDSDAQLIARDMHFEKLRDIARAKKPEEIR